MSKVKHALVSVSDKTGIVEFCRELVALDINIMSTGGTAQLLKDNDLHVTDVSDYTGFPEIMDGRIKTLHPLVHGGLLGRRGLDDEVMRQHGIHSIDLVVVNLYPFEMTVSRSDCTLIEAIENIDIGGPTMLRAAAKNHEHVAVLAEAGDYERILNELRENQCCLGETTRFYLARKVFALTANYDASVSNYLGSIDDGKEHLDYPLTYTMQFHKSQDLRYGENPHQTAAFYKQRQPVIGTFANVYQLQGKELSYNNIADVDVALDCVHSFNVSACVIVKHANPCGVAIGESILQAYDKAYATDPTSAFGGIIAFNRNLDADTARAIIERQFVEVIIAPNVDEGALLVTAGKSDIRVLSVGMLDQAVRQLEFKRVSGGLLIQDSDNGEISQSDLKVVSRRPPTQKELNDMLFAWKVVKYVKSNAIIYAKDGQAIGIGAGQMSRIYSAHIAIIKAEDGGLEVRGSVMASDAFFPFRDSIDLAANAGIMAVIQPGGSVRDKEVISAVDEHGLAMVFTGMRHFKH